MNSRVIVVVGLAAAAGALATLVSGARAISVEEPVTIADFWVEKP